MCCLLVRWLFGWFIGIDYRPLGHLLTPNYSPPKMYTGRAEWGFTLCKRFLARSWSEGLILVKPARRIAVRNIRG